MVLSLTYPSPLFKHWHRANFIEYPVQGKASYSQYVIRHTFCTHLLTRNHQAKGYPDVSTRAFLYLMSSFSSPSCPPPPIFALADYDPDGMAIMSTYKHGSWNLSHESARLLVPRTQWLGIQSEDVTDMAKDDDCKGLLRLSGRDRHKATKMLENSSILREDGEEADWRRELQVMLVLNVKAEMEILEQGLVGVEGWVERKLLEHSRHVMVPEKDQSADEMLI